MFQDPWIGPHSICEIEYSLVVPLLAPSTFWSIAQQHPFAVCLCGTSHPSLHSKTQCLNVLKKKSVRIMDSPGGPIHPHSASTDSPNLFPTFCCLQRAVKMSFFFFACPLFPVLYIPTSSLFGTQPVYECFHRLNQMPKAKVHWFGRQEIRSRVSLN